MKTPRDTDSTSATYGPDYSIDNLVEKIYELMLAEEHVAMLLKPQTNGILYINFEKYVEPILNEYNEELNKYNKPIIKVKDIILPLLKRYLIQMKKEETSNDEIITPEIRFNNVPITYEKEIMEIGSKTIDNLVKVTGSIIAMTDQELDMKTAVFECKSCMRIHEVEQETSNIVEPVVCSDCGGRTFELKKDKSEYIDVRSIIIEEKDSSKTLPARMKIDIKGKLTQEVDLNDEIEIIGFPTTEKNKNQQHFKNVIQANNIRPKNEININLSEKDVQEIKKLSEKENILQTLINSLAPNISYPDEIKKALLCYLVKGIELPNKSRKEIHILIVGDPGTGKSKLAREIIELSDKYTLAEGPSSTGVGLIASVVSEPLLNKNIVELGAFPKAHKGHCYIDEFDKLPKEHLDLLHNALESGVTTIHKSNIHKDVKTEVSVLATANPKYDRFDPYKSIKEQFNLRETILSRFDLIFSIEDRPDKEKDKEIAEHILCTFNPKSKKDILDKETLKKYLEYARHRKPVMTQDAKDHANSYYVNVRNNHYDLSDNIVSTDTRTLESIIRLAGAISKLKLKDKITVTEVDESIDIMDYCLRNIGLDTETGKVDISKVRGYSNNNDKNIRNKILEIIEEETKNTLTGQIQQKDLLQIVKTELNIGQSTILNRVNELITHEDILRIKNGREIFYRLKK